MKSLEALKFIQFADSESKEIIEKELKALEIIKKYYKVNETYDELFPYDIEDKQYQGNSSSLVMSKEEFELLKEILS